MTRFALQTFYRTQVPHVPGAIESGFKADQGVRFGQ